MSVQTSLSLGGKENSSNVAMYKDVKLKQLPPNRFKGTYPSGGGRGISIESSIHTVLSYSYTFIHIHIHARTKLQCHVWYTKWHYQEYC